ncbi:hypothetical protein [Odoribacter sp. Z80]|uniref:hypothetical protein n=1 Tax=Odoribacter sp. Z80 TaxID=2304575 RepID=UPI00137AA08B|nr:hypothetical protein [Odoribacter sp. Z80]NCE73102.1 hypothetical protein [Odoribacter sp. Z80]
MQTAAKKPPCAETADGCIIRFARQLGIFEKHTVFIAADGIHEAESHHNSVRLSSPHYAEIVPDAFTIDTSGWQLINAAQKQKPRPAG